eukprot:scaffold2348_cov66-Phaeocystis_antarctica.AAC.8
MRQPEPGTPGSGMPPSPRGSRDELECPPPQPVARRRGCHPCLSRAAPHPRQSPARVQSNRGDVQCGHCPPDNGRGRTRRATPRRGCSATPLPAPTGMF